MTEKVEVKKTDDSTQIVIGDYEVKGVSNYKFVDSVDEIPTLFLNIFAHPSILEIKTDVNVECIFDWESIPEEVMRQMYNSLEEKFGDEDEHNE